MRQKPDFSEATTNADTQIVFAKLKDLKAHDLKAHDPKGRDQGELPVAVGTLCAINAGLWCIAADLGVAADWQGSDVDEDYEENPKSDFSRALNTDEEEPTITIGEGTGLVVQIGGCGCSTIWRHKRSLVLLEHFVSESVDKDDPDVQRLIGQRARDLPAKDSVHLGDLEVPSGVLALLLPYTSGEGIGDELPNSGEAISLCDSEQALVKVGPGRVQVWSDLLEHEDELGTFETRTRFVLVD